MAEDLFASVDAALVRRDLPSRPERRRLRKKAGFTQQAVADVLRVKRETANSWERQGGPEPRTPQREAYARLLGGWSVMYGSEESWDLPDLPDLTRLADSAASPTELPPTEVGDRARNGQGGVQHQLDLVTQLRAPAGEVQPDEPSALQVDHDAASSPDQTRALPEGIVEAEPDRTAEGVLVVAEDAACLLCGRQTPYRALGVPRHITTVFCTAPAPVPSTETPSMVPVAEVAAFVEPPSAQLAQSETSADVGPTVERPQPLDDITAATPRATAPVSAGSTEGPAKVARYAQGPLCVLGSGDGKKLSAHMVDGTVLDCPASSVPGVVEWALAQGFGAPRLHRWAKDADGLVVLTASAAKVLGLPGVGEGSGDFDTITARLPEKHPILKQLAGAGWKLTKRGFGPWPRVYREPEEGARECVQFAVVPWRALTSGGWTVPDDLSAPDLARLLGLYAQRVMTPRGSTAVTGLELMTSLRPKTRPVRNPKAKDDPKERAWIQGRAPGSLFTKVRPAPPEVMLAHPLAHELGLGPDDLLNEEAFDWHRPIEQVTSEEWAMSLALGVDVNTAFLAATSRLMVGLDEAVHVVAPRFDKKIPGAWRADLSHAPLDPRLPNPFTPKGTAPTGPGWYTTQTLAYAVELGIAFETTEAWLYREALGYLDPWNAHLRDAYLATMAALGVTKDMTEEQFLAAMAHHKDVDPVEAMVLAAVKATAKGGIGKLREKAQGFGHRPGMPWPALERETWRPGIRAAVLAEARVRMHRKIRVTAEVTGRFPIAVHNDCVVYPTDSADVRELMPRTQDGKPFPQGLRLGVQPGMVKFEGERDLPWALEILKAGKNPGRHIKGHDTAILDGE